MKTVVSFLVSWFLLLLLANAAGAQSCAYFLNTTNGDDDNSGLRPEVAVRSFEYAFRTFPSGSVVCMTAGEYFHSLDADGVQLTGSELSGKEMRFVLQSFAGATEVAFTEDELRIDIGAGRVEFVAGSTSDLRLGSGSINSPEIYPSNTTFLHTLVLSSGALDVSGVDFTVGRSVGNPDFERDEGDAYAAPDSATIGRGSGSIAGSVQFDAAPRSLAYIGSGNISAADEVPPLLRRLVFDHGSGTVTIARSLVFDESSKIELSGAGDGHIESPVTFTAAVSPSVLVNGSGTLDVSGDFSVSIDRDISDLAHVESDGRLLFRHLILTAQDGAQDRTVTVVNSGSGILEVRNVETAPGIRFTLHNDGNGSCSLGTEGAITDIEANLINKDNGRCEITGATSMTGSIDNKGRIIVDGAINFE